MTFPRALARYTCGAVNNMTLHLAGHAAFAGLEHAGRKFGIVRHAPVRAFRAGDTVIVGLNFGRQSDWYQNITAAGTCHSRLGGERLTLGAAALVPAGQAAKDLPWLFGFAFRQVARTADRARPPVLDSSPVPVSRRQPKVLQAACGVTVAGRRTIRVRIRVLPRCPGGGAAARWAYGRYLLHRRHDPDEYGAVFAPFQGHRSPLRHRPALALCRTGGHAIWWTAEAGSEADVRRRLRGREGTRLEQHPKYGAFTEEEA